MRVRLGVWGRLPLCKVSRIRGHLARTLGDLALTHGGQPGLGAFLSEPDPAFHHRGGIPRLGCNEQPVFAMSVDLFVGSPPRRQPVHIGARLGHRSGHPLRRAGGLVAPGSRCEARRKAYDDTGSPSLAPNVPDLCRNYHVAWSLSPGPMAVPHRKEDPVVR